MCRGVGEMDRSLKTFKLCLLESDFGLLIPATGGGNALKRGRIEDRMF